MEKATLKQNIIREIVIALVCILLAISNTAFGHGTTGKPVKGEGKQNQKKEIKLTTDELALLDMLQKEEKAELKATKTTESFNSQYHKVLVYDMGGNLLQEQDGTKTTIDLDKLPKGAKLLSENDGLAIYLVL